MTDVQDHVPIAAADAATLVDGTVVEGTVDQLFLPVTLGTRTGTLRVAGGRVTYTRRWRRRVVFDVPASELHSFAEAFVGGGFHLWHGDRRYRFVVQHPVIRAEFGPGAVADLAEGIADLRASVAAVARSRAEVAQWRAVLVPRIAPAAPPGVRVRPPLRGTRFWLVTTAAVLAATTAVIAVTAALVLTLA